MKALTVRGPWASAIALGNKRVENRTWRPHADVIGQRIAIHAGRACDADAEYFVRYVEDHKTAADVLRHAREHRGCVVAVATVARVVKYADADTAILWPDVPGDPRYFQGPLGWVLEDVVALAEPVPCKGRQGLWRLPEDVERAVLAQVGGGAS